MPSSTATRANRIQHSLRRPGGRIGDIADRVAEGCANTALAADAARAGDPALRDAYVAGLRRTVEHLASLEGGADAHQRALQDLVVLVGGLTLARATAGDPISEELLAAARDLLSR